MEFWQNGNIVINGDVIRRFNARYCAGERYVTDDRILRNMIPQLCGDTNARFDDIYHAVILINAFYSTRMGADNCHELARILHARHADVVVPGIRNADKNAVQDIINRQRATSDRVAFSFTTKYFSILSRFGFDKCDRFPIYDSVVEVILDYYFFRRDRARRHVSGPRKVYDYNTYAAMMGDLVDVAGVGYKEMDTYLWQVGRAMIDAGANPATPGVRPIRISSRTGVADMDELARRAYANLEIRRAGNQR